MLPTPTPTLAPIQEMLTTFPSVSMIPIWFQEGAKWLLLTLSVISAIVGFLKLIAKPLKAIGEKLDRVDGKVAAVDEKVGAVQEDMADVQCHLLNQAHDYYMEKGWCPSDIKNNLSDMCDKYTGKGHNHIRPQYRDTLIALEEHPPGIRQPARPRKTPARKKASVQGSGQEVQPC